MAYFAQQVGGAGVTNLARTPWVRSYALNAGPSASSAPPPGGGGGGGTAAPPRYSVGGGGRVKRRGRRG